MKILFVSSDLIGGNLAHIMKKQGCDVRLYIDSKQQKNNFENLVEKTPDWEKNLSWVGKDGLIVFDDIGYGQLQDKLRKDGYSVFGGTKLGDKLESDRLWAQNVFKEHGLNAIETYNFSSIEVCLDFVRNNAGPWVVKQNGSASKSINYIGKYSDNCDVISVLENYQKTYSGVLRTITLQKRVYGVEIGVGRYFNGHDWVGPIEMNVEYKKFFPGDLGPATSEMGTLAWFDSNEKNKLFCDTLAKLKPFLQKIQYKGDIDIGCIVNKDGAFPLEATPRMGSPIIHLHSELFLSPWHEIFKAIADGKDYKPKFNKNYGIVVLVATPPFPYNKKNKEATSFGVNIYFDKSITKKEMDQIHFEEVSRVNDQNGDRYVISDHRGYILYVTHTGKTVELAQKNVYKLINKIYIPKMFYRNDIGTSFTQGGAELLKKWGYL